MHSLDLPCKTCEGLQLTIIPPFPAEPTLPEDHQLTKLVGNVRQALRALPFYFASETEIGGLEAGDLFGLNAVLGSTIEVQTVATLNRIREVWDPDNEWTSYGFRRSSQTFPDVRLVDSTDLGRTPILGIELKGWYLLAKEEVPTFRYQATPEASTEFDLLVVVPWHLSNVLSGRPAVHEPFVVGSKWAAEARNHYWQYGRKGKGDTTIKHPDGVHPYPNPKTPTSDVAVDSGGNFGRLARTKGVMDDWILRSLETEISGIQARHWIVFFKSFIDSVDPAAHDGNLRKAVESVKKELLLNRASSVEQSPSEALAEVLLQVSVELRNHAVADRAL